MVTLLDRRFSAIFRVKSVTNMEKLVKKCHPCLKQIKSRSFSMLVIGSRTPIHWFFFFSRNSIFCLNKKKKTTKCKKKVNWFTLCCSRWHFIFDSDFLHYWGLWLLRFNLFHKENFEVTFLIQKKFKRLSNQYISYTFKIIFTPCYQWIR